MDAANCSLFSNWCLTSLCTTCLKMFTISMRISAHECRKLFSIIQEMFDRFVPYLSQHFHLKYVNLCAWMPQTVLCSPGDIWQVYVLHALNSSCYSTHGCRKLLSIVQEMVYTFMNYILPMYMDAANCSLFSRICFTSLWATFFLCAWMPQTVLQLIFNQFVCYLS